MISCVIAEDHPAFLRGLREMLAESGEVEVVAAVGTGADAVAETVRLRPDAVLMDLHLPGGDGLEATREIVEKAPETAVLILTMYDDDASVRAAIRAGARGYLLKEAGQDEIVRGLSAVARGEVVFGRQVAGTVLARLSLLDAPAPRSLPGLTTREVEILALATRGLSNADIARRLVLSDKTVRNHLSNIFAKLGVTDRAAAAAAGRAAGLDLGADQPAWRTGTTATSGTPGIAGAAGAGTAGPEDSGAGDP